MPYAELVLLFDTDNLTDVEGQLGRAFDDFSVAGKYKHTPTIMIVRKMVWLALEKELAIKLGENASKGAKYNVAPSKGTGVARPGIKSGYNALIYRARPVVAIAGHNIVADRVGANNQ